MSTAASGALLPRWIQSQLRLDRKIHELAWGALLGIWGLALIIGLLLAIPRVAPPGALFWVMPTLCGALFYGFRFASVEHRLGVEEFTLALPVGRTQRYWLGATQALLSTALLSAGTWLLLYAPIWVRGLRDDGDHLTLNGTQALYVVSLAFALVCGTFAFFSDSNRLSRYDNLAKLWPWLLVFFTFAGTERVELGRDWPLLWALPFWLVGPFVLQRGLARYLSKPVPTPVTPTRGHWAFRVLEPLLGPPGLRRGVRVGELRTLDGSWSVLIVSAILPTAFLAVMGDGIPRAYLPWVMLGVVVLYFSAMASWVAGARTDFSTDEFVGALPPLRRHRFRTRFLLGLGLATAMVVVTIGLLASGVVVWLVSLLPDVIRRGALGAEPLAPLWGTETLILVLPVAAFCYAGSYFYSSRHREMGKDGAENAAGFFSIALPALALIVVRFSAAAAGIVLPGLVLFATLLVGAAYLFARAAERRALTVDVPEPQRACSPLGWQFLGLFSGVVGVALGFGLLLGVGEADRLGRFYAAGTLEATEFMERLDLGPRQMRIRVFSESLGTRGDCYALARDAAECETRASRRTVRYGGLEREAYRERERAFEQAEMRPELVRYGEEFAGSGMEMGEFVARLEEAYNDPDLEVADRGWYARSGRSLEEFKRRQNEIRDLLSPIWGGRAQP